MPPGWVVRFSIKVLPLGLPKDAESIGCVLHRHLEHKGALSGPSHVIGRAQERLKANDIALGCAVIGGRLKAPGGESKWLKLPKTCN